MRAVLGVEVIQIGDMLEVVCINGAVVHNVVRHDIVVVNLNVKRYITGCQDLLCDFQRNW